MKSKRTITLAIATDVRKVIHERDKWCILCGKSYGLEIAHYVSRGSGGMGIEENLVLLCQDCHRRFDQSKERITIGETIEQYLQSHYQNWEKQKLIYKKRGNYE